MKKLTIREFAKKLSPRTRGILDAKEWVKMLKIIYEELAEELSKGNSVRTPFGEFYIIENAREMVVVNGQEIPVRHKYQVRCSCSRNFKETVNAGKK